MRFASSPPPGGDVSTDDHQQESFATFYGRQFSSLVRSLILQGFDPTLAQDAASDAMLSAYDKWETLEAPLAWVKRTAYYRAIDASKERHRRELVPDLADEQVSYEDISARSLTEVFEITGVLASLPPKQRLIMVRVIGGYSYAEIAAELRTTESSVRSAVRHARSTLRQRLEVRQAEEVGQELQSCKTCGAAVADLAVHQQRHNLRTAAGLTSALPAVDDLDSVVSSVIRGDKKALEVLLRVVRPLAVRYCRARIGRQERSFASADDAAQEVCLAVLKSLPSYRDQGRPFLAFVYGIAAHKVADAHRASSRNRSEPVADVPDMPETDAGPEQQALRGELSREMVELLKVLPDEQREILLLRVVVGLSAEETAIALGLTSGAVRVAHHRALTKLRKTMTPEQMR